MINKISNIVSQSVRMIGIVAAFGIIAIEVSCQKNDIKPDNVQKEQTVMYNCPMHPTYVSAQKGKCPICGMDLVPMHKNEQGPSDSTAAHSNAIRIDPAVIQNIGVQIEPVQKRSLQREVRATATIQADEQKMYVVSTKIMGYVEKLHANYTGQFVKKGQPLYSLYSPDLITAQDEYLRTFNGIKTAKQNGISTGELTGILYSTRKRLLNWDISDQEIANLEARGTVERTLTFYSLHDGNIVEKNIVEGQSVEPGMQLFTIIDYSTVWLIFSIYQQDLSFVQVGLQAEIDIDFYRGTVFKGLVTYISPQMDQESRTIQGRIELNNTPDLKLKPGMFATVRIKSKKLRSSMLSIPEQAVIHSGERTLVIIAKGNGFFEPREVATGMSAQGYIEIMRGLDEGEVIVVSSQFLIDSESNLRAVVNSMRASDTKDSVDSMKLNKKPVAAMDHDIYICPMHPDIVSDKPGDCPKCGMHLVLKHKSSEKPSSKAAAGKKEIFTCTMCSEILTDKPGKCPKCGMKLVPLNAKSAVDSLQQKTTWICTMCPEIKSDKPGDCPKCGMHLEPQGK